MYKLQVMKPLYVTYYDIYIILVIYIFSFLVLTLYTYPIHVTSPWTILIEYGMFHKYSYEKVCGHFGLAMVLT